MEPDGLFDLDDAPQRRRRSRRAARQGAARGADATRHARRGRRPGAPAAPGAPLRRLVEGGARRVGAALRAPSTGKTTIARLAGRVGEPALRRALGALVGGAGSLRAGDRGRPPAPRPAQPPDRAVHRRGPPLLQDPAGRPAGRRWRTASCCWSPRPPRTRRSRWCRRCCRARWCCGWSRSPTTTSRALLRRAAADERGWPGRSPVGARRRGRARPPRRRATPGGRSRRWRTPPEGVAGIGGLRRCRGSTCPRWSGPSPRRACATTAKATSTTTSSARSSSPSAAPTPDAALHYLARMLVAGEDPRFIARRLMVHASEDVGLADPTALQAATAAAQVAQLVGLPECRIRAGPGHAAPGDGTEVERRRSPRSTPPWPTCAAARSAPCRPPARRALRGRAEAGQRGGLPLPARRPGRRGGPADAPDELVGRDSTPRAHAARAGAGRAAGAPAPGHPRSALTSTANCMAR